MEVIKRNGKTEKVDLNKVTERISKLVNQKPKLSVDPIIVASKVIQGLYDKIPTRDLDILSSQICATMASHHHDYDTLAARLVVSNLHKETEESFMSKTEQLYKIGILNKDYYDVVKSNIDFIESYIDYSRDFEFDYFGLQTLKRSYLLKDKTGKTIERPQDLWMRVSIAIHGGEREMVKETYDLLSKKYFIHATPTLFNAGTIKQQLSSCFLIDVDDDSIGGIYKTLSDVAKISQSAGGIGLSIHKIRAKGSYIKGTNGTSNGIVPMLRVFDTTARYVDQGGGKRKGSIAVYLEPWHSDIFEFLDLKKNHGKEELRARDLFYAMWVPDLFMERVEKDEEWCLFDPAEAFVTIDNKKLYLYDTYGDEFKLAYQQLELEGKAKRTVKARELWEKILVSQIETGTPYLLFKDSANEKSNQQNLGTIKSSNLCVEIMEYTSPDEIAVCNLASLSLPAFVDLKYKDGINYDKLYEISRIVTRNLNKVIDINYYPVKEAKTSNMRHRPIGIGVQGLADVYAKLKLPFTSDEAKEINKRIFETIYKGAVDESINLAREQGVYSSYEGSPASQGKLQFDLWGIDRSNLFHNWDETYNNLRNYGLRNSLLLAPMPTASTSQILGNNECFEPYTSNLYTRRTLAGEFIVVNRHLVKDLENLGLWNESMRQTLMRENGSIQNIIGIPQDIKNIYKTVWEMSMRDIIDMSADRGAFICQSQSLNLFVKDANLAKLTSMHFYSWKKGLKTGMYYLRTEAARDAIKFTVSNEKEKEITKPIREEYISNEDISCSLDNPEACESCSG